MKSNFHPMRGQVSHWPGMNPNEINSQVAVLTTMKLELLAGVKFISQ